MTLAFKEWSYIVDALGKGKQSIIIRKGGISEDGGDFTVKGKKFLLFPTQFHQAEEMIKEEWLKDMNVEHYFAEEGKVKIEHYSEVIDTRIVQDWNILEKLNTQHAWKPEVIKERFTRWEKSVHLLIVQVYRLSDPFYLDLLPEYGGCKSWINIENVPELSGTLVVNQMLKGRF